MEGELFVHLLYIEFTKEYISSQLMSQLIFIAVAESLSNDCYYIF